MRQFDLAFRFPSQGRSTGAQKGDEMRGWTTGLMMAIGLVAIPVSAAPQPLEGDPAMAAMSRVRSRHPALQALIARPRASSRRRSAKWWKRSTRANGIVYIDPGTCRYRPACVSRDSGIGG